MRVIAVRDGKRVRIRPGDEILSTDELHLLNLGGGDRVATVEFVEEG